MGMTKKIEWISILQAITIASVVAGHLELTGASNPDYPIASWIDKLLSYQMPTFFFISGYLFVRSSLFNKTYKEIILSKINRLIVPYFFILFVMFCIKFSTPSEMLLRPIEMSPIYIIEMIFDPWNGPARHLWFLISLFTFFLLSPILKLSLNNNIAVFFIVVISYLMVKFHQNISILSINKSMVNFMYFYIGMVVMKFNCVGYLQKWYSLLICTILYILSFLVDFPLNGLWGIGMIVGLSYYISLYKPSLFSSFSKYSYQIYLMHVPPLIVCKMVDKMHLIGNENLWFPLCWIITLVVGIFVPVMIAKIVERFIPRIKILIGL